MDVVGDGVGGGVVGQDRMHVGGGLEWVGAMVGRRWVQVSGGSGMDSSGVSVKGW